MSTYLPLASLHPQWQLALRPVATELASLEAELSRRVAAGEIIYPPKQQILRCFSTPLEEVKVLIVGQDPYHTPATAVGLSFAVSAQAKLPPSLRNIFKELAADLDVKTAASSQILRSPDLSDWAQQGVCLMNRVLTVTAKEARSHRKLGWESITNQAVQALVEREQPLVVILWGKDAQELKALIPKRENILLLESAHPSPLSARHGFFGSRPFTAANEHLQRWGRSPIKWL